MRQTTNRLLREYFDSAGHSLPIDWDELAERQVDRIFDALLALEPDALGQVEADLRDVCDMASEDGIRVIVEEARDQELTLDAELEQWDSRYDKAMWTKLHHPEVWNTAVLFAKADSLSHGRCWVTRGGMPDEEPRTDAETIASLRHAVSAFFRERQARGLQCYVDYQKRGEDQHYFFVYLSDYADTYLKLDDREQIDRIAERRAFEVVFVYDRTLRSLEMFAKGGKPVIHPLQEIFASVVLGTTIKAEIDGRRPYELDHLMNRSFGFPYDPADGIRSVRIKSLRVSIIGSRQGRITLDTQPDDPPDRIYEMLERDLDQKRLPKSVLHVTKATIYMKLDGYGRRRSLTFSVVYPDRCDLKSKPEELRMLGEKYLREWRIHEC